MKERSRVFAAKALLFLGLLVLAWAIYLLVSLLTLPAWAQAFLVMVATKVLTDLAFFRRERRFQYFEDYLRELFVFMTVAGVSVVAITAVEYYLGGAVWVPLPAAALTLVWR